MYFSVKSVLVSPLLLLHLGPQEFVEAAVKDVAMLDISTV